MHWTQRDWPPPFWQYGFVGSLQSAFATQTVHCPRFVSQTGAATPQSAFVAHAAHWLSVVLQMGVVPLHCALLVQPARHWKPCCGSQIGCAVPQSEFERHCTHM
jgi:hypothetical protein